MENLTIPSEIVLSAEVFNNTQQVIRDYLPYSTIAIDNPNQQILTYQIIDLNFYRIIENVTINSIICYNNQRIFYTLQNVLQMNSISITNCNDVVLDNVLNNNSSIRYINLENCSKRSLRIRNNFKFLKIHNCNFDNLEIFRCTDLEVLIIDSCYVMDLDISQCNNLKIIIVKNNLFSFPRVISNNHSSMENNEVETRTITSEIFDTSSIKIEYLSALRKLHLEDACSSVSFVNINTLNFDNSIITRYIKLTELEFNNCSLVNFEKCLVDEFNFGFVLDALLITNCQQLRELRFSKSFYYRNIYLTNLLNLSEVIFTDIALLNRNGIIDLPEDGYFQTDRLEVINCPLISNSELFEFILINLSILIEDSDRYIDRYRTI